MRIELKSLLLTLATLPAILSEGAPSKVLQLRLHTPKTSPFHYQPHLFIGNHD